MKKTTSQSLSKRLARYGALAAAIGGIAETNGQVMYSDITDFAGNGSLAYDLNLDGDGTVDFQIFGYNGSQILVDGNSSGNSVAGSMPSYKYPFALDENITIGPSQSWQSGGGQIMRFITSSGQGNSCLYASNWCDNAGDNDDITDKFLGFKFKIGADTHYGWARLDIIGTDNVDSWIIKDYAYDATPDTPIAAGAGILGVDDLGMLSNVDIVVTEDRIELYRLPETTNYALYSITGQQVLKGTALNNRYDIETNGLTHGIYILEIEDANTKAIYRKKVVLR
jgi:hypothetical protein